MRLRAGSGVSCVFATMVNVDESPHRQERHVPAGWPGCHFPQTFPLPDGALNSYDRYGGWCVTGQNGYCTLK
ncbi:hypothetical protein GCM10017771_68880 [Streptomyces capitiformicae]|uniref:Uncharacterized protein n=1 Tax=Streptomyces capitiformicae TaxID=2014920 RepID=A0A918ZE70_9ACTN|nr:hypothetical protein GCM10017771_68880 [Streptomyces capitiformicae]